MSQQFASVSSERQVRTLGGFGDYKEPEVLLPLSKPKLPTKPDYRITRNYYGAEIVNLSNIFIADIDIDPFSTIWFMSSKKEYALYFLELVQRDNKWKGNAYRVYETHSGFRIFITNKYFNPVSNDSKRLLQLLKSDELYSRACGEQECYRARLTPKPCRVGTINLNKTYTTDEQWIIDYNIACKEYVVCKLRLQIGEILPEIQEIIDIHDEYVLNSNPELPFA